MATVFIADDSHLIRKRLINVLSDLEKIDVVGEAESGAEAIKAIRKLRPEVVILDVCMSPGSGLDVLRSIKGDKSAPIVIMYTNHPFPQFRKKCIEYGADFFFDKTHEFTKLFLTIENLSQGQSSCE